MMMMMMISEPGWLQNLGRNAAAALPDQTKVHDVDELKQRSLRIYAMSNTRLGAKCDQ